MRLPDTGLTGIFDAAFACPTLPPVRLLRLPGAGRRGRSRAPHLQGRFGKRLPDFQQVMLYRKPFVLYNKKGLYGQALLAVPKRGRGPLRQD